MKVEPISESQVQLATSIFNTTIYSIILISIIQPKPNFLKISMLKQQERKELLLKESINIEYFIIQCND